jgi:AraC-like DNA-binding protein
MAVANLTRQGGLALTSFEVSAPDRHSLLRRRSPLRSLCRNRIVNRHRWRQLRFGTEMPSSTIAVFSEPQAFEAALQQGCRVELLVTGHGQFRAQLISIALPRLRLLQAKEWLSRIAVVSAAPGSMLVLLSTETEQSQIFRGVSLLAGEIMTVTAGEQLHMWTVGPCRWGIISISAKEFVRYGQALVGRNFALPPSVCRLRPRRGGRRSLVALFNSTMRLTEAQPSRPIETEGASRGLEQEAIRVLVACLSMGTVQAREAVHRHSAIMACLDQLLQASSHEIPRIPNICAALGISATTLQACCQRHVGVSLGRYFHLYKLRRVHNALIDAYPDIASVSRIAKCHGFNDPGRFAAAYREQFGELPSATLRRGTG